MKTKFNAEDLKDHHGVSAIIYDEYDNILMQNHKKLKLWTIPIGKVKEGQPALDALKKELLEECGITVNECKEVGCFSKIYKRFGISVKITQHIFLIKDYSGQPENLEPHKHESQVFMSLKEIKKIRNLSDATMHMIYHLPKNKG